jgi:hypothetical protein
MHTYWFFYRSTSGAPMRATIRGNNVFEATQAAKAIYGPTMLSESVNFQN